MAMSGRSNCRLHTPLPTLVCHRTCRHDHSSGNPLQACHAPAHAGRRAPGTHRGCSRPTPGLLQQAAAAQWLPPPHHHTTTTTTTTPRPPAWLAAHLVHAQVEHLDVSVVIASQEASLAVVEGVADGHAPAVPARGQHRAPPQSGVRAHAAHGLPPRAQPHAAGNRTREARMRLQAGRAGIACGRGARMQVHGVMSRGQGRVGPGSALRQRT